MRNNYSSLILCLGVHKGMEMNGMEYNVFKQEKGMEKNRMELSNIN